MTTISLLVALLLIAVIYGNRIIKELNDIKRELGVYCKKLNDLCGKMIDGK